MRTHHLLLLAVVPACMLTVRSSAQSPMVQAAIDAVSLDTMMRDLEFLTGEEAVDVGNGPEVIFSRNKNQPGNPLAALWLQQRLVALGYTPAVQIFSAGTGENVLAVKPGAVHPGRKVVICGHYDAMPGGPVAAPAADDDGSGTVAVLEAARVLAPYTFENTIVFALWDEEEQGLLGSEYWAGASAANDDTVLAAVNMDAISYDGDGDGLMRVHTRPIANSIAIKDSALAVNADYGLGLNIAVNNPGATYSDHAAFWNEGYGAILIIEDFDNDGNPYYHTSDDLIEHIDQPYFHGLARLGIGTTAVLAVPLSGPTGLPAGVSAEPLELFAYPNPMHGLVQVRARSGAGDSSLELYDAAGRVLLEMNEGMSASGRHAFDFDARSLPAGSYTLRLRVGRSSRSLPMVRLP